MGPRCRSSLTGRLALSEAAQDTGQEGARDVPTPLLLGPRGQAGQARRCALLSALELLLRTVGGGSRKKDRERKPAPSAGALLMGLRFM